MEIGVQIKKYRTNMMLSQEELAGKVFVTRQTISNWENNKSYPDIHSLLLLSSLFNISLDQLVKGDIDIMRKEIGKEEHKKFNHVANVFTVLCIVDIVSFTHIEKKSRIIHFTDIVGKTKKNTHEL